MRFVTVLAAIALSLAAVAAPVHPSLPTLTVNDENGNTALSIQSLHIDVIIRGHLARTTYEITYANNLDRDLDGDFSFPLPPDAEVSDIALYFGTVLRHGVAVQREQARTAYDETIHRRRVDPALAEWSSVSRAFHFRVYPIPARGTKLVHIAYDQEIAVSPYELDLRYGKALPDFRLSIDGHADVDVQGLDVRRSGDTRSVKTSGRNIDAFVKATASDGESGYVVFSPSEKTWYASARVQVRGSQRSVAPARHITIFYDASASAVHRDAAKLRQFLAAFLARQDPDVRVSVVPFHVLVEGGRDSTAQGLDSLLSEIPIAGATNLADAIDSIANVRKDSRVLLITDGVNNIGESSRLGHAIAGMTKAPREVTIVNASRDADDRVMGELARASGGWLLDLNRIDPGAAAETAMQVPSRIAVQSASPLIRDLLPQLLVATKDQPVVVNARSREEFAALPIISGAARHEIPLRRLDNDEEVDLVRRAWARARLHDLLETGAAPDELLEHGRRFNQLTPRTSLLILETWRDYELWQVPIPKDLLDQRAAEIAQAERMRPKAPPAGTVNIVGRSRDNPPTSHSWFIRGNVELGGNPLPGATVTLISQDGQNRSTVTDANGSFFIALSRPPSGFTLTSELEGVGRTTRAFDARTPSGAIVQISMRFAAVAEAITVTAESPLVMGSAQMDALPVSRSLAHSDSLALADRLLGSLDSEDALAMTDEDTQKTTIVERTTKIKEVIAKLQTLESPSERYRYYAAARSILGGEKLFQATAALALRGESPEMAVRVLTDLVEAWPDDAATLRLIGRVLVGWHREDLAQLLFERAIELEPDRTQSWRELMLLVAAEGKDQALTALQRRYQAATHDPRMAQIDRDLEQELRLRHAGTDPRIDASADIQIESMWDSNYTDVDLHVIEPDGEEVFYNHLQSKHGGHLHEDVTTGFGPETYTIAHREKGAYKIVLVTYSGDNTRVMRETLAHVIVWVRGERRDFVVALPNTNDKIEVAVIE